MKLSFLFIILLSTFIFSGCAGSPYRLSKMSATELETVSNDVLLKPIRRLKCEYANALIVAEVKRRNLLTDKEIIYICENSIYLGMTVRALRLSWGMPNDINRTVTAHGTHEQYVYGSFTKHSKPKYVYVENGKVTSWQN